jgi:electron transfer flavoprotein alpha subunit
MDCILVPLHTGPDGTLPKAALEAVAGARLLADALPGSSLVIGLVGDGLEAAAGRIGGCGAARVLSVSGAEFSQSRYASDVAAVEALAREAGATMLVAPGTPRWARALPGVAHRLGGQVDTHVVEATAADGTVSVTRWFYRQRMRGTLQRSQRPWVIVLDPGTIEPWTGEPVTVDVKAVAVELPASCRRTTVTGVQEPPADQQTIRPDADLLFVAGAGWTKKQPDGQAHPEDAERIIVGFLAASHASLGGSKSLVDLSGGGQAVLGFMTHLNQVGQTGATPRHPKGLSTCCHGEEPHAVGWRFITERRAINLDPNCGWAQGKADVLYVADAFQVMSRVNALLSGGR